MGTLGHPDRSSSQINWQERAEAAEQHGSGGDMFFAPQIREALAALGDLEGKVVPAEAYVGLLDMFVSGQALRGSREIALPIGQIHALAAIALDGASPPDNILMFPMSPPESAFMSEAQ